MTTFAEMETLVVGQTRRPEVTAVTQAAIRTATLRAHHTDFFKRDLSTGTLTYTPSSSAIFYDFTDISTTLLRMRAFQLMQSVDAATLIPSENFEYRELQDLYDSDNVLRTSMYTMIGDTLRVYPASATGRLDAYYYRNPVTTEVGYSSWIANEYPDELAMWAAAIVFARTGFAEMAADFQKTHVVPFKELLIASHLLANVN
jgi:hypothetical protein